MHADNYLDSIDRILRLLTGLLDVTCEIRNAQEEPNTSLNGTPEEQALNRKLYATISATRQSTMVTGPGGETCWGIPMVIDGTVSKSFVVVHGKPPGSISPPDINGKRTISRIQQTADGAVIELVENVLRLLSCRQDSEQELDSLASELSLRYEELNVLYKIGGRAEATTDFINSLSTAMSITGGVINSDYSALCIPSRNIISEYFTDKQNVPRKSMQQLVMKSTPALLKLFSAEIQYFTDHDAEHHPALEPLLEYHRRILAIPMCFDGNIEGILLCGRVLPDQTFATSDQRLMRAVADMLAIKITNAELFEDLKLFLLNLMKSFVRTIEEKDPYTHGHSERVNQNAMEIGKALGLSDRELTSLNSVSLLHDIGKIGVPEHILNKPGLLTPDEYETIKQHPFKGYKILEPIKQLRDYLPAVLYHHERIDGKGYPEGRSGEEIPLLARIIAVADTFDAMTSDRAYRKAKSLEAVIKELIDVSGTQLDARITRIFITKCLGVVVD